MLNKLKDVFFNRQFLTFVIIGCLNTLVNSSCSALLIYLSRRTYLSMFIGYSISVIFSYCINARFTFKTKPTLKRFPNFLLTCIPNFIIQWLCVFTVVDLLHGPNLLAVIIAPILSVPLTFVLMKFKVFTFI